uniref:FAD dependent oxidoreductase domain-containing protein n=1 Tax=Timema shepardi TaxID=629360 RepID=A0A7R9AX19_TIMSH|nr:unnamed protein product [Timema shepardi]
MDTEMPHRVAVVGGGVIGLTTAVALQERLLPSVDVTVLSENFSPDTTGDGAAGLWEPYITGNTSVTNITKWAGQTYRMFRELWQREDGQEVGLSMLPITNLTDHLSDNTPSFWSEVVMGYRMLDPAQLARLGKEHGSKYTKGYTYVTFICEATKFLPYLQNRLLAGGGHLVRRKVTSLDELAREDYRVIVNCTGLQARHLVGDTSVVPVRGQVLRVSAPWQNEVIIDLSGDGHHIIPNQESVVIGGTHQEGSWDLNVDPKDTQYILEGCKRIKPALKMFATLKGVAWDATVTARSSSKSLGGSSSFSILCTPRARGPHQGRGPNHSGGAQLRTRGQRGHPMLGLCHPGRRHSARGTSGLQALSILPAENIVSTWLNTLLSPQELGKLNLEEENPHLRREGVDNHLKYTRPRFKPQSLVIGSLVP